MLSWFVKSNLNCCQLTTHQRLGMKNKSQMYRLMTIYGNNSLIQTNIPSSLRLVAICRSLIVLRVHRQAHDYRSAAGFCMFDALLVYAIHRSTLRTSVWSMDSYQPSEDRFAQNAYPREESKKKNNNNNNKWDHHLGGWWNAGGRNQKANATAGRKWRWGLCINN